MSADSLWRELQKARAQIAFLEARISGMKAERESVISQSVRRRYGSDLERDEEGRAVTICIGCHRLKSIRARGLCAPCYMRWRRSHGSHGV